MRSVELYFRQLVGQWTYCTVYMLTGGATVYLAGHVLKVGGFLVRWQASLTLDLSLELFVFSSKFRQISCACSQE